MITAEMLRDSQGLRDVAKTAGVTHATIHAWVTKGVAVGTGRVKLAAFRVGRHWAIPPGALDKFLADCNPAAPVLPESPAAEARRGADAKRRAAELLGGAR